MRLARILALVAAASALGLPCAIARADVFHYDVTISVTDGSANWHASTETGSYSSSWSATWPDVTFFTTPAQKLARIEPASFPPKQPGRATEPVPPKATPTGVGASGSWHGTNGANWSCSLPPGFDLSAFGSPALVLVGGGLDEGVKDTSTSYAETGKFGLALNLDATGLRFFPPCSGIDSDPYEAVSPYVFVGIDTCFADPSRRGDALSFPVERLGEQQIAFKVPASVGPSSTGGSICWDRAYGDSFGVSGTYDVSMTRSDRCLASYGGSLGVSSGDLDRLENFTYDRNTRYQRGLLGVMRILREDARRHPGARARRDLKTLKLVQREFKRFVKDFKRSLDQGRFQDPPIGLDPESLAAQPKPTARAAINEQERATLNQALGCGLDEAKSSLQSYLTDHGVADGKAADLAKHLSDLERLLNGSIDPASKEGDALMKSELIGLVTTFGKLDKGSRLPKAADKIYDLLRSDKNKVLETLDSQAQTEVKAYAKTVAGKDGEELAKQLFTLRDVLSGKYEDDKDKQFSVLKDSVAALASRLVGEDVLKLPQVRAAMFGFKLGKAFGDRIAADLKIVASTALVRECKQVIAKAQGVTPAEIDYTANTNRVITSALVPGTTYADWICKLHPESHVDDLGGGVIEAISPVNKLFGRSIPLSDRLGIHLTGGESVFFDTAYSNVPG